jgi:hypothetical protein
MGFYLAGIIYATPASFSSRNSYSKKSERRSHDFDVNNTTGATARGDNGDNNDKEEII